MALSSFLVVNGVSFPTPRYGFQYVISTAVNAGRNVNNVVIGQRVGRDLIKLDAMEWVGLEPSVWQSMLAAVEPFYFDVTFEDYRTGEATTIKMYRGDITAKPLFADESSYLVTKYESCKMNFIDCGE